MLFNSYIWSLYTNSEHGRGVITRHAKLAADIAESEYGISACTWQLDDEGKQHWGKDSLTFHVPEYVKAYALQHHVTSSEDAARLYDTVLEKGVSLTAPSLEGADEEFCRFGGGEDGYEDLICDITLLSLGLSWAHPDYFLPYFFQCKFYQFRKICEAFDIPIPPVPGKQDWYGRARYYFRLNQSLQEFRALHGLSPAEMCAFLYDFAPEALREQEAELPSPSKVWLITGGAGGNGDFEWLDQSDDSSASHWQGNIDTRRGDILLMHCVSPRSYIHSIWRATTDGFVDPFFFYHSTIWIGSPVKTVHVTFAEMKVHPLLSQKGAIRAHLQGPSGKAFTVEEYRAVLDLMAAKGQDVSLLPTIEQTTFIPDTELTSERDVEIRLIEPLLKKLGYQEKDWIRQMSVPMGRGERNYPDYVFGAQTKKGEEKAAMILESKFRIGTRRELTDAYCQAKSYALRLQAKIMIVAAVEGVWVFRDKNGFSFEHNTHKNWKELENPDTLHEVRGMIGKTTFRWHGNMGAASSAPT